MNWFKHYEGLTTDTRLAGVARKTGTMPIAVAGIWCNLLECASQGTPRGSIEKFDIEGASFLFGMEQETLENVMRGFVAKGMLQSGMIADWEEKQGVDCRNTPLSTSERSKRYRDKKRAESDASRSVTNRHVTQCDASRSVTNRHVTQCDESQNKSDGDDEISLRHTERKEREEREEPPKAPQGAELPASPCKRNNYPEDFEQFWAAYPKACNKTQGFKAYLRAQKERRLPDQEKLLELLGQAVAAYRANHAAGDGFQYFKDASTWLNNNGWEDVQAKSAPTPVATAPAASADDARARREQEEKARQKALFKSEHRRIMEEIRRKNETY